MQTKVNGRTRAGRSGKIIYCPVCGESSRVYHFSWCAITCRDCGVDVDKNDWNLNKHRPCENIK